jgi:hypothetical protein
MGRFGWSYPPGCSGPPGDDAGAVSDLQEAVLGLLEDAGIPTETNDAIMKLIDAAERAAAPPEQEDAP